MLGFLLDILWEVGARLLWWILLFPVVWLVSAPFILVAGLFSRQPYIEVVWDMFEGVHSSWKENGFWWVR